MTQLYPASSPEVPANPDQWQLRLYVANQSPRSLQALANLTRMCEKYLPDRYTIEVIDLFQEPERAGQDQIIAIPTLVRTHPQPVCKLIGDLSDTGKLLAGLGITAL
ncbi:MAG: circadian clock protein KaiB [Chloroflexi bacterium]|nr:MAG: circadian clock protein KaiB [Chloroflexota bacterium]